MKTFILTLTLLTIATFSFGAEKNHKGKSDEEKPPYRLGTPQERREEQTLEEMLLLQKQHERDLERERNRQKREDENNEDDF